MRAPNRSGDSARKDPSWMADNPLAALAATHPELEVWFDSSPLIYDSWKAEVLSRRGGSANDRWTRHLEGVWDVLVGCTTNPPLTLQAVEREPDAWAARVDAMIGGAGTVRDLDIFWTLYREVVRSGAELFKGVFERSGMRLGYISGQVDPRVLDNTAKMVAQGIALNAMSPNIMVKMPGVREGILGITLLTALGIPTNATLVFTLSQIVAVAEAVKTGVALARTNAVDLSAWRSVCTMMLGRFEDHPDLDRSAASVGVVVDDAMRRWAGVAIFNKAVRLYRERGYESKMLAASMRVGPEVNGKMRVWHLEKLAGQPVVLTIFPNIIESWIEHYDGETIPTSPEMPPPETLDTLLRIPYFREAYEEGQEPETFRNHGAVIATAESFSEATDQLQSWVRSRIERVGLAAAG